MGNMDLYENQPQGEDFDFDMSYSDASYGGTGNALGDTSVSDQKRDVIGMGSARGSDVDCGLYDNLPLKSIKFTL